jgi:hypothetical protein
MSTISYVNLGSIEGFNTLLHDDTNNTSNILKLNKLDCRTENNQQYKIITYDKTILNYDLVDTYGLCRSVIVNSKNNVVSFAPPKSFQADNFLKLYPQPTEDIIAQEFVEGTMINVFFDPTIGLAGGWEIATRNIVGATCGFYSMNTNVMPIQQQQQQQGQQQQQQQEHPDKKTFRTMFLEAAKENNLILENLNTKLCYSFVLQHPNNRIVIPFKKPQLYLIAIYYIDNNDKNNITVFTSDLQENKDYWQTTSIKFPEIYEFNDYSELIDKYASMNTGYDKLGVVLYNKKTCQRTKIRNPVYEEVRHLRGNQSKLQFQYLTLRKEGKMNEFLKFFPENKREFSLFRDQVHLFTNTLFYNYISCYMKKEKQLKEFSPQYKTHMFNIHEKYKNELKPENKFVTNRVVIEYVNNLQPQLLMHSLNYNYRLHMIDIVKTHFE